MHQCPHCSGSGSNVVHVSYANGISGWEKRTCGTCHGVRSVSDTVLRRVEEGKRMRDDRRARGQTLAQEAERLGMSQVELVARELGRFPTEGK